MRYCPHCRTRIPIDSGFIFDKANNLVCAKCLRVAFSVQAEPPRLPIYGPPTIWQDFDPMRWQRGEEPGESD